VEQDERRQANPEGEKRVRSERVATLEAGFGSTGMRRGSRRHLLQASLAFGGFVFAGCSTGRTSPETGGDLLAWPAKDRWPNLFANASADVQEAYRYAVGNQNVLQYMPCFCGCGASGHRSNWDCYVREARADGSVLLDSMSFG
jgi:hypothetical protein